MEDKMIKKYLLPLTAIVVFALLILSCATEKKRLESALASITAEDLTEDVVIFCSDEFEGRFPASKGEEKIVAHLKAEFEKAGLKPGNGESFF